MAVEEWLVRPTEGYWYKGEMDPVASPGLWDDEVFSADGAAQAMWRAGFLPDVAPSWYKVGVATFSGLGLEKVPHEEVAAAAARWSVAEFEASDALHWIALLASESLDATSLVHLALSWRQSGFTPTAASPWLAEDGLMERHSVEQAAQCASLGWTPVQANLLRGFANRFTWNEPSELDEWVSDWLDTGYAPCRVLCYARAGLPAEVGFLLAEWHDASHVEEELHIREVDLPSFSPERARVINQLTLQAEHGDSQHRERQFCLREVPVIQGNAPVNDPDAPCPGTGSDGGFIPSVGDEWNIECSVCGAKWAGGSIVPEHKVWRRR